MTKTSHNKLVSFIWSIANDCIQVFFTFTEKITQHPGYHEKFLHNNDPFTKELANNKIVEDVAKDMRKVQLEFAKQWLDHNFKEDFKNITQRYLGR